MCLLSRKFYVVNDEFRKHLNEEIKLPQRATNKSSGYDFYMPISIIVNPNERKIVWSDIKADMEEDEVLMIYPRSSLGIKGLILSNTIGVIDCDYFNNSKTGGNIGITLWNTTDQPFSLQKGERVCQGVFSKYLITKDDSPLSDERLGGMGSSGTH